MVNGSSTGSGRCPQCDAALRLARDTATGVQTGFCAACGGRWTTIDEARALQLLPPGKLGAPGVVRLARCPACVDAWLVPAVSTRGTAMRPLRCPSCDGIWLPAPPRDAALSSTARVVSLSATIDAPYEDDGSIEANPATAALVTVVASFAIAVFCVVGPRFLLDVSFAMAAHELGHAFAALFSGRWAVPLPFITLHALETSVLALVAVSTAIVLLGVHGWRRRLPVVVVLAVLAAFVMLRQGWFGDEPSREMAFASAGIIGEFVVGTVLVVLGLFRANRLASWDVTRHGVIVLGLLSFVPSSLKWAAIARGAEPLPLGSAFGGRDDAGGDINRLLAGGMDADAVIAMATGWRDGCLAVIAVCVIVALVRGFVRRRAGQPRGGGTT